MEFLDTWIEAVNKSIHDFNEQKGLNVTTQRPRLMDIASLPQDLTTTLPHELPPLG